MGKNDAETYFLRAQGNGGDANRGCRDVGGKSRVARDAAPRWITPNGFFFYAQQRDLFILASLQFGAMDALRQWRTVILKRWRGVGGLRAWPEWGRTPSAASRFLFPLVAFVAFCGPDLRRT